MKMKNPSKGIFGIHDVDQGTRRMNYEVILNNINSLTIFPKQIFGYV